MTPQKIAAELVDLNHHDARLIARIDQMGKFPADRVVRW